MAAKKNLTSQGYPSSTSGYTATNLRDRGYPSSMEGYTAAAKNLTAKGYPDSKSGVGSAGLTGSKLGGYTSYTTPTTSYSGSSSKKSSSSKTSGTYSGSVNTYGNTTQKQYGGDYDLVTGEYNGPGSTTPSYDYTAAYRKLIDAYKNQQSNYQNYLDMMNNTAQGAYDKGMSTLNDTYDKMMELLTGSYDTQKSTLAENLERAKNTLLNTYNTSRGNLSTDAESSLKQAYISNMLNRRNIAQQLSAMGLNGGMTETTLAGIANNYGNNRNNIQTTLNKNLAELEGKYNTNLSDLEGNYSSELANALQAYNNSVANANAQKMQQILALEDALANNKMQAYSNYQNMLDNYQQTYYNILRQAIADGADISY